MRTSQQCYYDVQTSTTHQRKKKPTLYAIHEQLKHTEENYKNTDKRIHHPPTQSASGTSTGVFAINQICVAISITKG